MTEDQIVAAATAKIMNVLDADIIKTLIEFGLAGGALEINYNDKNGELVRSLSRWR